MEDEGFIPDSPDSNSTNNTTLGRNMDHSYTDNVTGNSSRDHTYFTKTIPKTNPLSPTTENGVVVGSNINTMTGSASICPSSGGAKLILGGWLSVILQSNNDNMMPTDTPKSGQIESADINVENTDIYEENADLYAENTNDFVENTANYAENTDWQGTDNTHSNVVTDLRKSGAQLECQKCRKVFASMYFLKRHQDRMHKPVQTNSTPTKESNSNSSTTPASDMEVNIKSLMCNLCGRTFASQYFLDYHCNRMHADTIPAMPRKLVQTESVGATLGSAFHEHFDGVTSNFDVDTSGFHEYPSISSDFATNAIYLNKGQTDDGQRNVGERIYQGQRAKSVAKENTKTQNTETPKEKVQHMCKVCEAKFQKKSKLLKHMTQEGHGVLFKCIMCDKSCQTKASLEAHAAVHSDERRFKCPYENCDRAYKQIGSLNTHLRMHRSETKFIHKCQKCDDVFDSRYKLLRHKEFHEDKNLLCNQCGKSFLRQYQLDKHIKDHQGNAKGYEKSNENGNEKGNENHSYNPKKISRPRTDTEGNLWKCEICEKILKSKMSLKLHEKRHGGDNQYVCNVCGRFFNVYVDCKRHLTTHSNEKSHLCPECGQQFKLKYSLTLHLRKHNEPMPFKCHLCGIAFSMRHHVIKHKRREHPGYTQYNCEVCGKEWSYKSGYDKHMRIHTGERPYTCNICGKGFKQKTALNMHVRRHNRECNYRCPTCGKGFFSPTELRNHVSAIHEKVQHSCEICFKTFSRKKYLNSHAILHTRLVPFSCVICPETFVKKESLVKHLKKKHKCQ